jgi:uncharacterized membrane protein
MAWQRAPLVALLTFMPLAGCASPGDHSNPPAQCTAGLPSDSDCATAAPSYSADIAPLVSARCLECHEAGNKTSPVVLETRAQIYNQRQLVETQVYRCAMPPSDGTPLASSERALLLKWLVCGAPDN